MIVERIEENIVVIENDDGDHFEVLKNKFPENIKEGDFVLKSEDNYIINVDKTTELRKKNTELQNSLWN
ncbi:MAG: DUF3006 domain-containing protein [Oscillospiraceae bacterium]|nr:DUF3006 domain-containing protein [Oscillospiraceae bacterium]